MAVGWIKDRTGSFEAGLYALAGFALMSAVVTLVAARVPRPQEEYEAPMMGQKGSFI
jgi:ACS family tartrate transporter-like MFS transporter